MTDDRDTEDPAVTLARAAAAGAVILGLGIIVGGLVSALNASAPDVNAMAGGWTAIGSGFLLSLIGAGAAFGHSMIMRRANQRHEAAMAAQAEHHEAVLAELAEIRAIISPASDIDRKRSSR